MYGGNAIWNKYVLRFFWKIAIVSCFQSDGEFIPDAATEKTRLPKLSFVLAQ